MTECMFCGEPVSELGGDMARNRWCKIRASLNDQPALHVPSKSVSVRNADLMDLLYGVTSVALATRRIDRLDSARALWRSYGASLPWPRLQHAVVVIRDHLRKYDDLWAEDSAPLSAEELQRREQLGRTFFWRKVKETRNETYWLGDERTHREWAELADWLEQGAPASGVQP